MQRRQFQTTQGEIWLWGDAHAFESDLPILLVLTGAFATADSPFFKMQPYIPTAAVLVGHIPGNLSPHLAETSVPAFAAAYGEVLTALGRPAVVLGESAGALIALALRTPLLKALVLIEPPLVTDKLWPLVELFRPLLASPENRAFIVNVFGYDETQVEGRDYRPLLAELATPTQVFMGSIPLDAPRDPDTSPSLVDDPERELLKAHRFVRTTTVIGAGHNFILAADQKIADVCQDFLVRFAGVEAPQSHLAPPEQALLHRTPLTARRVLYIGAAPQAFAAAYGARNPAAELTTSPAAPGPGGAAPFDAIAVVGLRAELAAALAALIEDDGCLVATIPALRAAAQSDLADAVRAAGLALVAAYDPSLDARLDDVSLDLTADFEAARLAGPAVLVLRKAADQPRRMIVQTAAYTPFRMDIRTRLPAEGLRSSPDLAVALTAAPAEPLDAPADRPKVLVLQRPSQEGGAIWRTQLAEILRRGWVTVLEFDDHPALAAQMSGQATDWTRFALTHAIQTSTPSLEAAFRPWNPQVKVFANAVFDLAPFAERHAPHRIFYGALRRGRFALEVIASLDRAVAAFPDTEFVVVGDREVFDAIPSARKTFHGLQTYETYLKIMSQCSISLSPIAAGGLQETKSDAKFLDAASRGLLTIASPTVYRDVIRHGETGLIAERLKDWAPLLASALADDAARNTMARAAWDYVRSQRMFAQQVPERIAWYEDLWRRRDSLIIDLLARVPGLAEEFAADRA